MSFNFLLLKASGVISVLVCYPSIESFSFIVQKRPNDVPEKQQCTVSLTNHALALFCLSLSKYKVRCNEAGLEKRKCFADKYISLCHVNSRTPKAGLHLKSYAIKKKQAQSVNLRLKDTRVLHHMEFQSRRIHFGQWKQTIIIIIMTREELCLITGTFLFLSSWKKIFAQKHERDIY